MCRSKFKQLEYECDSWKRTLRFMTDENIHLKSRLSGVIGQQPNAEFLLQAEQYQNEFIRHDDLIGLLRNELSEFNKFLIEFCHDSVELSFIEMKLDNIRHNISFAQNTFNLLKINFNSYLLNNL